MDQTPAYGRNLSFLAAERVDTVKPIAEIHSTNGRDRNNFLNLKSVRTKDAPSINGWSKKVTF